MYSKRVLDITKSIIFLQSFQTSFTGCGRRNGRVCRKQLKEANNVSHDNAWSGTLKDLYEKIAGMRVTLTN